MEHSQSLETLRANFMCRHPVLSLAALGLANIVPVLIPHPIGSMTIEKSHQQYDQKQAGPLSLLTWNIHGGEDKNGQSNLQEVSKYLTAHSADIVCLQEVPEHSPITGTSYNTIFTPTHRNYTNYKQVGNAILTKLPVVSATDKNLVSTFFRPDRKALAVSLSNDNKMARVMTTHLDSESKKLNIRQGLQASNYATDNEVGIVCADFNESYNGPVHKKFYDKGYKNTSCTFDYHHVAIDGVLVQNDTYSVVKCEFLKMPRRGLSDHDPFMVTILPRSLEHRSKPH